MIRFDAEHDTVRLHEVVDRCPFLEELWIGADMKRMLRVLCDGRLHFLGRSDRNRRFGDDHRLASHVPSDYLRDIEHVTQVR